MTIADQYFTANTAITTVTLPAASGGDAGTTLTYTLSRALPTGLAFNAGARTISGTPAAATARTEYTYTVTESDGDTASLKFNITVGADNPPPSNAGMTLSDSTLTILEGTPNVFTVALAARPTGDVTLTLTSSNADVTLSDSSLRFTTGNWNAAQTVTVRAV